MDAIENEISALMAAKLRKRCVKVATALLQIAIFALELDRFYAVNFI
ncbi:MAG: hypothetical protein ACI382_07135 [Alloprevotella sp.]